MDVPGMSLFQGTGSIHINTSSHDREEEEALLEDQRLRNEELKNHLEQQFAEFDDDDDDSSINNSTNFTSMSATRRHSNQHAANIHQDVRNPPAYVDRVEHDCSPQQMPLDINNSPYPYSNDMHYKEHYNNGLLHDGNHNQYMEPQYGYHEMPQGKDRLHQGLDIVQLAQEDMEKLKLMYDLKSKECQQLEERLSIVTREADGDRESLQARLAASQQERKQADFSLQQSQNLFAQSKCKIVELEQEIQRYKKRMLGADDEREGLRAELEGTALALADAQQRLHARQLAADARSNSDALFREQQDRHRQETDMLQEDLEKLRNRLAEKERELLRAEKSCSELKREKEEAHTERSIVVNRLVAELDAAQERLAATPDAGRHKTLTLERNAARTQLVEMAGKLESTAQELVESRTTLQRLDSTLQRLLDQAGLDIQDASNKPCSHADKLERLSQHLELLSRQLKSRDSQEDQLKQKIEELEQELEQRNKTLEEHKQNEELLKSKLQELKSVEIKLNSDVQQLQNKLELVQSGCSSDLLYSYRSRAEDLEEELEQVKAQLKAEQIKLAEIEIQQDRSKNESVRRKSLSRSANLDLEEQLQEARKECAQFNTLYYEACKIKDALNREIRELKSKDWESELSKEREKSSELNRQLDRLNEKMLQQQKAFTDKLRDHILSVTSSTHDDSRLALDSLFDCETVALKRLKDLENDKAKLKVKVKDQEFKVSKLQKELGEQNKVMEELKSKLKFQEAKNEDITLLKNKAAEFETYIMQQYQREVTQRHAHTQTEEETKENKCVNSHDTSRTQPTHTAHVGVNTEAEPVIPESDSSQFNFDIIRKEKQIRQEIAKQFALELKTLEGKYRQRMESEEQRHNDTLATLKELLETKMREVDVLKNLILSERNKISELLQTKEKDMTALSEENERTRRECKKLRDEYVVLKDKINDFKRLKEEYLILKEKINDSKKMRDEYLHLKEKMSSYNEVKHQLEKCQLKLVKLKREASERESEQERAQSHAKAGLEAMEKQYAQLKEKYRSAKKTAVNYKEYAEEKDRHSDGELSRIRAHYDAAVSRLQAKLDAVLTTNEHKVTRQINKMESDFEAKINELNDIR